MDIVNDAMQMREWSRAQKKQGRSIAFVPTMGCLHQGHLSLIDLAAASAEAVVVSIFVNPLQFGPTEDFAKYPRPFDSDADLCRQHAVAALFAPSMDGFYAGDHSVYVEENVLSTGLCGKSRPGHFRGVTTVVCKLLNIVEPDIAVFGSKDAQQVAVIKRMVRDLNMPQKILTGAVVREEDGLAMSSRNRYLSASHRQQAAGIYRGLVAAEKLFKSGQRNAVALIAHFTKALSAHAPDARLEYAEIVNLQTMESLIAVEVPAVLAVAVKIGSTRLIDNIELK